MKKILDKLFEEFKNIIFKKSHDIKNCKLVKYEIYLINKKLIKRKQLLYSLKINKQIR